MKAYLISGIGADHRMFEYIRFPDNYEIEFISWVPPFAQESISAYAYRLFNKKDISQPFILVGISFGGMIAVEIAKLFSPAFTIIISSIPLSNQLPKFYLLAGKFRLNEILPAPMLKWLTLLKQQRAMKSRENKKLIAHVIRDGDNHFIKWGISAVLKWTNHELPPNLYHIHGNQDSVFPISHTHPTHPMPGGHMLILSEAPKVNRILQQILTA